MKAKAIVTRLTYQVDLMTKQYLRLEKRDESVNDTIDRYCSNRRDPYCLAFWLPDLTHAFDVNYDGHFGAQVSFCLDADDAHEADIIAEMIKLYATGASYSAIFEASKKIHKPRAFISVFESYLVK